MLSRRQTLTFGAASLAAGAAPAFAAAKKPIIINALGGIMNPNIPLGQKTQLLSGSGDLDIDTRSIIDARASGVTAVNCTLGYVAGPQDPHAFSLETLDAWDALVKANPEDLLVVRKASDILKARDEGKVGLIYGFQNALQVGEHLERVDEYAARGVRVIQLTYNPANTLGDGSMAPQNRGLSPLGRQVVEKLNAAKVMVDLSHSGERTCLDAIAASKTPISINHTGCRALTDLPRNKTDAELRGTAEKGGFVGIYFMPFLTLDGHPHATDVVAHIEHALKVCGEDHVGIGTDGSITAIDDLDVYKGALEKEIADRVAAGIGAKGERPDTYPFVVDLRGVDQFRTLAGMLSAKGYPARVIDKVLGLNFLAYARTVWG
ncbi:dipeptidase [Phenylobacterium aquaticum]|uniref:dipeptidase n=1 Tax=Phenylobacterium aquaticum TaxID=1763816 RepID=UPI0026EA0BAA|nr:membrane dipeptidase [Phenylobacterium aquaticum]